MTETAITAEGRGAESCGGRRADLRVHEVDGEALIFDPVSGDTHRLNETALFIWQLCDGEHDAGSIAARLASRYDVAMPDAAEHVERTIKNLEALGLTAQAESCEA